MMKRRSIATKISITKQGELKFFQVKIPFDAISIIGIETAMRFKNVQPTLIKIEPVKNYGITSYNTPGSPANDLVSLTASDATVSRRNSFVGELKLQSSDDSNVFYATNVLDHSVKETIDNIASVNFTPEVVWVHGYKRKVEDVLVDANTTILAGLYKDRLGEMLRQNISYEVFLYVWYNYKKEKNDDDQSCT